MYAIIETGGKQYTVKEGDILRVEKLGVDSGEKFVFDKVLMVSGDEPNFGKPYVEGASVEAEVLKEGKARKVIAYKYKAKKGYSRKKGHRQPYTQIKIEKISL